jgi:NDP-sugar pyrophosphorylase family protein
MPQNDIKKTPMNELGYGFIPKEYLKEGQDEYLYRNIQNRSGITYRHLTAFEIEGLVRNNNTSDNWNNILVSDFFNSSLVKNCKFYGLVRISKLEPFFLEFSDLQVPVGLYNSTIISSDIGDNVCIDNVNYLSHQIIGNEVIINNVNELVTTNHAKFGNGIIKQGEDESIRIWLEICNENGGRSVIPFNDMLPGDAFLWSKYRDDTALLDKFKEFTEQQYKNERGYYGKIGARTVIKNCSIIKDVWIGEDAYIKGANKLKNLTINSGPKGLTQIGEGVELVNGIIGFGCRIFYGVKAVRFVMASNSQLKYGARLINSYLGNNATISCCEVLNSLIFPAHEQHHNNSFLCAALIMGQSNIAAGATIGSNHNSRGADGEIVAGRGFWPGLCVSLKHNSQFASYSMISKGDYSSELNISIPFSLITNDITNDRLVVMPGYWFMYNMYAIARNTWKYQDRDKRVDKIQHIEYEFLAPDTVNEMFHSLTYLEKIVGKAFLLKEELITKNTTDEEYINTGKNLLESHDPVVQQLEIVADGFENSKRKTIIIKVDKAYHLFKELIAYYGSIQLIDFIKSHAFKTIEDATNVLSNKVKRKEWLNVGGQLLLKDDVDLFKTYVKEGKINDWDGVHHWYAEKGTQYAEQKFKHAIASLAEIKQLSLKKIDAVLFNEIIDNAIATKEWITKNIYDSRAKDYENPYRAMVYDNAQEMESVIGKLEDNTFINHQLEEIASFKKEMKALKKKLQIDIVAI